MSGASACTGRSVGIATDDSYVLAEVAGEFAFRLPRREQQRLTIICRQLAGDPFGEGDYVTKDQTGRALQNRLLEDWVVTYWADHAVKELRITEIVQV